MDYDAFRPDTTHSITRTESFVSSVEPTDLIEEMESTTLNITNEQFEEEKRICFKYFDCWSSEDQIDFVEDLLLRMTHYQHGHINSFLKPMLQRDFISALPGMC